MISYTIIPNQTIEKKGIISEQFIHRQINTFHDACLFVHNLPYGYNSTRDDMLILFKEGYGSCTTKHGVIVTLAKELNIPVYKMIGIYPMIEELVSGTQQILEKYKLPYLPMIHCFLLYNSQCIDLTSGNNNGKNKEITDFLYTEKVQPNISEKDEYMLYKNALQNQILQRKEMTGIPMVQLLHARSEGITLLRSKVPDYRSQN